jgi:hypothetical protein
MRMALLRHLFIFFGLFLSLAAPTCAGSLLPISKELEANPKLWAKLLRKCDSEIAVTPRPVAILAPHPHYSADGTNAKDPDAEAFAGDGKMAYRAGLCFALSKKDKYALHAQRIADAWALKLHSVPNAQGVADVNFNMPFFVFAAAFAADAGHWDQTPFKAFLTKTIVPLSRADKPNNHGNWGVLLNAVIAAYLEDEVALKAAELQWQALMISEIVDDGSMPLEMCRSDSSDHCGGPHKGINGIAYTHFALLPTTLAAEIFNSRGSKIYESAGGAKLKLAFQKVLGWTQQPETFPFYVSNNGKLNGLEKCSYMAVLKKRHSVVDNITCKTDPFFLQILYQ